MAAKIRGYLANWTMWVPGAAIVVLILTWGRELPPPLVTVAALFLGAAVLAAVHHAEVVAHRVGEPFGSLVLAVAARRGGSAADPRFEDSDHRPACPGAPWRISVYARQGSRG